MITPKAWKQYQKNIIFAGISNPETVHALNTMLLATNILITKVTKAGKIHFDNLDVPLEQ